MKPKIKITRIPYEEPYHLNLIIEACNGHHSGSLNYYSNASDLSEIGRALIHFPTNPGDQYVYELGSEDPKAKFAFYFRFRVYTTDSIGHSAIELRMNNNAAAPNRYVSEFSMEAEPAAINRLGKLFQDYSKLEHDILEWSPTDEGCIYSTKQYSHLKKIYGTYK